MSESTGTDFEVPSFVVAQAEATLLVIPSFICDIGLFGGAPTMRFWNNSQPEEIWQSADCVLTFDPMPHLPFDLSRCQRELPMLESLYGASVHSVECRSDGGLSLGLSEGRTFSLSPSADQEYPERWTMINNWSWIQVREQFSVEVNGLYWPFRAERANFEGPADGEALVSHGSSSRSLLGSCLSWQDLAPVPIAR